MSKRVSALKKIKDNTYLILKNVSSYSYIDPWYYEFFKKDYVGKKVAIFGSLQIPDLSTPLSGVIIGYGCDKAKVKVIFKHMSKNELAFIEENNPMSHHSGTVVKKNGKIFLYMTNVLGVNL